MKRLMNHQYLLTLLKYRNYCLLKMFILIIIIFAIVIITITIIFMINVKIIKDFDFTANFITVIIVKIILNFISVIIVIFSFKGD